MCRGLSNRQWSPKYQCVSTYVSYSYNTRDKIDVIDERTYNIKHSAVPVAFCDVFSFLSHGSSLIKIDRDSYFEIVGRIIGRTRLKYLLPLQCSATHPTAR